MSIEYLWFFLAGFLGGAVGGYLGLGGGIIVVPFLTLVANVPIKVAVPVSVTAIVANSIAASNEYLKKGMVDFELAVVLAVFMVMGSIVGSLLNSVIPDLWVRMLFSALLIYSAISFLRTKQASSRIEFSDNRKHYLLLTAALVLLVGVLAGLLGVGGGVVLVPLLYLFIGVPLAAARGTSSFLIGFSSAAAMLVYFFKGSIDLTMVPMVILGVIAGGKTGGYLGTLAKPMVVKLIFFFVMLFLAFKLAIAPLL